MVAVITLLASVMVGCQQEDDIYNQTQTELLDNVSFELEEYMIAGLDYQYALNIFNSEIKNIDFSKLNTFQDPERNTIVNIPTSVSIEEKAKIFNEKKKQLLDKCPQIISFSSQTRRDYFQQRMQNSSNISKKMLDLGIHINQPRLKGFSYESFSNNDHCTYLDSQIASTGYVEIVLMVFEDGTSVAYIDDTFTSTTCNYPPLAKQNGKWYWSGYSSSAISYIAHTHRYSSSPSPSDYDYNYPGLQQGIYTSGCNVNIYQQ